MFGNKLATATAQVTALLAALKEGLGFEAATAEAVTPAALQNHRAAIENAAAGAAIVQIKSELAAYVGGLASVGITIAAEQLTADGVKQAIETKIAAIAQTKAVETVASSGHAAAIPVAPGQDVAPSAETMTKAELSTAIGAEQDPVKRKRLYTAFEKRFLSGRN
jgi:hypothetical protein